MFTFISYFVPFLGKAKNHVPMIIPKFLVEVLDRLHADKDFLGAAGNKKLFFSPGSSVRFTDVHHYLKKLVEMFDLKDKFAMCFTNLRKQLATSSQASDFLNSLQGFN